MDIDIKKATAAIQADAGVEITGLEQSLKEMKRAHKGRVYSSSQLLVREVREMVGYSQQKFAAAIQTPVTSLRDWEQGRHNPPGIVSTLMNIIKNHPEIMNEMDVDHH